MNLYSSDERFYSIYMHCIIICNAKLINFDATALLVLSYII